MGDEIRQEVVYEGLRILEQLTQSPENKLTLKFPGDGCNYYLETDRMMDPDGLQQLEIYDAIYFS